MPELGIDTSELPKGAKRIEKPQGPQGAKKVEDPTMMERLAEIPTQFVGGMADITNLLAEPITSITGDVAISDDGEVVFLSPGEVNQLKLEGRFETTLPGAATREPTSLVGRGARVAGQTAAVGPVLGRAAGAVPKPTPAATRLGRAAQFPQKVLAESGKTFAKAPIRTTIGETGLGFTAGGGGFIAQQTFPDSDAAIFIGEIVGGVGPAFLPINIARRAAGGTRNLFQIARHPFTETGGRKRAAARAQRAGTPEQRAEALAELDLPTTLDPVTEEAVLTPAQRTGQPGLLSLERSVMESSEDLRHVQDAQIANANEVIQQSLEEIAPTPPTAAIVPIKEAQDYLSNLMDTRLRVAALRADERIAELGPKATREQLNRIAGEEIDKVLVAWRTQEKQLYEAIPENTAVPFKQVQERYELFIRQLGKPQQTDIPDIANKFLSSNSKDFFGNKPPTGFLKGETRIKDLRALQSKLRQEARNARSGDKQNLNKARIADELADIITEDLSNAAAGREVSDQISVAVEFSRDLNQRFRTGTMSKILGKHATGAERVPAGLTLEESIGVTGPKAREALDEILRAFDLPDKPSSFIIVDAAEDFTRTKFLKDAVQKGELNIRAAERFLLNNDELLTRMPGVRSQIEEAISSGNALALVQRQRGRIKFDDPRISKATMLIDKGPVETFRQISKLKSKDAQKEIQQLVNRVSKDETGEALSGLKSGFLEFLYSTSREKARDVSGLPFISGFAMRDTLKGIRAGAKRLFSEDELKRIDIVIDDLTRLEKRRAATISPEGVIADKPSKVVEVLAGVTGAAVGRTQAQRLGIGGTVQIPGIFADRFRALANAGVKDPAGRLIRDMITDEDLFKELLQSSLEDGGTKLGKVAERRLNAWFAVVLAEYGGAFDEDEPEEIEIPELEAL